MNISSAGPKFPEENDESGNHLEGGPEEEGLENDESGNQLEGGPEGGSERDENEGVEEDSS